VGKKSLQSVDAKGSFPGDGKEGDWNNIASGEDLKSHPAEGRMGEAKRGAFSISFA